MSLLLFIPPAALLAQQEPYYPGPQQPYSYSPQYDPGQQYANPYPDQGPPPEPDYGYSQGYNGYAQPQALGPDQLEQLIAPIALNPDQLVALMLAASTYPAQVQDADRWRQAQGAAPPDQIAYGAGLQAWDPSVKALTAFPQVLAEMDQNIQWTAALGNAYYNEPQDVLEAIQIMRQRAQAAGNLESTAQESVSYDQGNIQLLPANSAVVYVPAYNPWTVYGEPVDPYPGFSLVGALGSFFNSSFGSSAVQFGLGTVLSAFSGTPFGLLSWGLNWLTNSLFFNNSNYYTHSGSVSDWGLRYGGPRAWMAPRHAFVAYNRGYGSRDSYGRGYNRGSYNRDYQSRGYGFNRNQQAGNRYPESNARHAYGSTFRPGSGFQGNGYRNGLDNRAGSSFGNRQTSPFANHGGYNYGNTRSYQNFNQGRSYQARNYSSAPFRSQQFGRSGYGSNNGSGFVDRSHPVSNGRYGYGNGFQSYRGQSGFNQRSINRNNVFADNRGYNGFSGSEKSSHGGFHPFGGNRNSDSFGRGSFKEPHYKAPKMPKSHGGSFGGGGHHSFGGGGHSHGGGGHSHGGGHGGGHHH